LAREIVIYQSSYTYDISANDDMIHHTSLSSTRHGLFKLFAFSFLMMRISLFLTGTKLHYVFRSDIAYQFFIAVLIIDVFRMFILAFVIQVRIQKYSQYKMIIAIGKT
jgi:hypothetical protein